METATMSTGFLNSLRKESALNDKMGGFLVVACNKAQDASQLKLNEMLAAGPKFSVHNDDFSGKLGPAIGTMLDNCGGAWIVLPGKCALINWVKKHFKNASNLGGINTRYEGPGWTINKGRSTRDIHSI
jgi:hypothetical protein